MFENFDFGFDLPTVIVLIAFVAAFASVMAVATLGIAVLMRAVV